MFFFFHLFAGVILGYLISEYSGRRLLLPCALGAVLSDLIDKPLGYLILGTILDDGRIYAHSLLFPVLLLCVGMLIHYRSGRAEVTAVGIGVLSHQVLDLMWRQPSNWLYPFLGPFQSSGHVQNYFLAGFIREISSPAEWLWGFVFLVVLFFYLRRSHGEPYPVRYGRVLAMVIWVLAPVTVIIGLSAIGCGIAGVYMPLTGWSDPQWNLLWGMVMVATFIAEVRYAIHLQEQHNDCTK